MKRFERYLFPHDELLTFFTIICLSGVFSFLLIGRQVYQANWGLIDDHEIFRFLGPSLRLPPSEIWSTLLTKTEVGTFAGRFRPTYYVIILIETSLFGADVHLWYLLDAVGFAIFLSSIWWFMHRFIGNWLSGVLTAYISLLPLWAGVWSRLGPSEIYGAACIGVMVFAAYFIFFADAARTRNASAVALTLATVALIGMKETFLPLAAGPAAVLLLAGIQKRLPPLVTGLLGLVIFGSVGGFILIMRKLVLATGTDFYADSVGIWPMLKFAAKGLFVAVARTWWLVVFPILFLGVLNVIPRKPLGSWIAASPIAAGAYGFLVVTYAAQCALYRSDFPLNIRYDFPAMLLVPLTCCILTCDFFYKIRPSFSQRTIDYAQFSAAAFLFFYFALGSAYFDHERALATAVRTNIETTNLFYNQLQLALHAAQKSPESPIILEAYGPGADEPVYSLSTYLSALGARNRISVRLHPDEKFHGRLNSGLPQGTSVPDQAGTDVFTSLHDSLVTPPAEKFHEKLYEGLEQELSALEQAGGGAFTPLRDSLANNPEGCISIGINGLPDPSCSGFQVKVL
jgi:hypothetical protein